MGRANATTIRPNLPKLTMTQQCGDANTGPRDDSRDRIQRIDWANIDPRVMIDCCLAPDSHDEPCSAPPAPVIQTDNLDTTENRSSAPAGDKSFSTAEKISYNKFLK